MVEEEEIIFSGIFFFFFVFGCIVLQMRKFYLEWATTDASQCGWNRRGEAARPGRGRTAPPPSDVAPGCGRI